MSGEEKEITIVGCVLKRKSPKDGGKETNAPGAENDRQGIKTLEPVQYWISHAGSKG